MATGTVRHPKGPAQPPAASPDTTGAGLAAFVDSTVGGKILVALTGIALVGFTVVHMIGNLKLLPGGPESREAINGYGYFLKHELGAVLWIFRGGLLGIFVLHLALALRLHRRSAAARPVPYHYARTAQASVASRTMVWTGIVVGLFVLFHLAHYTFGWVKAADTPGGPVNYLDLRDAKGRHDVYEMTVAGFRNPVIAGLYLVAQVVLFVHLRHGIPSVFQTLGLKNARSRGPIDVLGLLVALAILAGNAAIVLAVALGFVKPMYTTV